MPYSTINDLLAEFNEDELARITGDPTGLQINVARIDYARLNADVVIDSYLIGRYDIVSQVILDPVLTKLSVDLTVSNLFEYFYARTVMPNTIVWRRLNAMSHLRDIQQGKALLVGAYQSGTFPPAIIASKTESQKTFTNEILEQFNEME
jgi:phage gp36-like protein